MGGQDGQSLVVSQPAVSRAACAVTSSEQGGVAEVRGGAAQHLAVSGSGIWHPGFHHRAARGLLVSLVDRALRHSCAAKQTAPEPSPISGPGRDSAPASQL